MTAPLPRLVVVTDGKGTGGRPLAEVVASAVDGGARAVWLRDKHLPRAERHQLASTLAALLAPVGGMLVASPAAGDVPPGVDGVHLGAVDAGPLTAWPGAPSSSTRRRVHLGAADARPLRWPPLTGRSCHSAAEVAQAAAGGCAYVTLSPLFASASKPGYGPPLGPSALSGLPLPAWGLGGVDAGNARSCVDAGGAGVAVMGAIMGASDPGAVTAAILAALDGT